MSKQKKRLFDDQQPGSESHKDGLVSVNILTTVPRILIEIKTDLPADAHADLLIAVDRVLKHYGK